MKDLTHFIHRERARKDKEESQSLIIIFESLDEKRKGEHITFIEQALKEMKIGYLYVDTEKSSHFSKKIDSLFNQENKYLVSNLSSSFLKSTVEISTLEDIIYPEMQRKQIILVNKFAFPCIAYRGKDRRVKWLKRLVLNMLPFDMAIYINCKIKNLKPQKDFQEMKKILKTEKETTTFYKQARRRYTCWMKESKNKNIFQIPHIEDFFYQNTIIWNIIQGHEKFKSLKTHPLLGC